MNSTYEMYCVCCGQKQTVLMSHPQKTAHVYSDTCSCYDCCNLRANVRGQSNECDAGHSATYSARKRIRELEGIVAKLEKAVEMERAFNVADRQSKHLLLVELGEEVDQLKTNRCRLQADVDKAREILERTRGL